ncbi:MAG: hypothetical protein SCH66_08560 [Methanolobus sp.]|nr:hypothetical protein [Methanolobus sp.]
MKLADYPAAFSVIDHKNDAAGKAVREELIYVFLCDLVGLAYDAAGDRDYPR